jgi:hypothetical protein
MNDARPPRALLPARRHLHVLLFAVYPVVLLYQQNMAETAPAQALAPLRVVLAVAAGVWLLLTPVFADREKRAVAAAAVLVTAFYYRLLQGALAGWLALLAPAAAPLLAHLALLALLGAALVAAGRARRSLAGANRLLTLVVCALLAWSLAAVVLHHARGAGRRPAQRVLSMAEFRTPPATAPRPDIYCIFLDEFASLQSARDLFAYDNEPFAERLRRSGFFVARDSRSLHEVTGPAMASVLNMEPTPAGSDPALLVRENRVARFLSENGYAVYDFPYRGFAVQKLAREHFAHTLANESLLFDDFVKALFDMSVLYPLSESWQKDEGRYLSFIRRHVLYVFEELPKVARRPGPKFVLVHLYSPHAPFLFDRDGGPVPAQHSLDYSQRRYYLEQYRFVSRRIAETVEKVLAASPAPPVIVLQSDHGYRGSFRKPLHHVVPAADKRKIFLALLLPGRDTSGLDPALSPADVFRVILNGYLGQRLPLRSPKTSDSFRNSEKIRGGER